MFRYPIAVKEQVVAEYLEGMTSRQLADKYKIDKGTVIEWVRLSNGQVKAPNGHPQELKNKVVAEYSLGYTSTDLSKKYNVDSKTITIWVKDAGIQPRNSGSRPLIPKQTPEERKAYVEKNKEKIRAYNKEWRKKNHLYMREYDRKRRELQRDHINAFYRTEKYKVKARKRQNNRYKNDPQFRLRIRLRKRIKDALKDQGATKTQSTLDLIGCSLEDLKKYLESKFTEGMSWALLFEGKIHIDHIRPCVSFDLTDPEEQKRCFNYTNLQPLWPEDNYKKGDKWSPND